jgi:hypothetical protein
MERSRPTSGRPATPGRHQSERPADFDRNRWPTSIGMPGRHHRNPHVSRGRAADPLAISDLDSANLLAYQRPLSALTIRTGVRSVGARAFGKNKCARVQFDQPCFPGATAHPKLTFTSDHHSGAGQFVHIRGHDTCSAHSACQLGFDDRRICRRWRGALSRRSFLHVFQRRTR